MITEPATPVTCPKCGHTQMYKPEAKFIPYPNGGESQNYNVMTNTQHCEEGVNHPPHYGGADNPYEAIKVIEAWKLGFHLGNVVKYISRHGKKTPNSAFKAADLRKAKWYLDRKIEKLEGKPEPPPESK